MASHALGFVDGFASSKRAVRITHFNRADLGNAHLNRFGQLSLRQTTQLTAAASWLGIRQDEIHQTNDDKNGGNEGKNHRNEQLRRCFDGAFVMIVICAHGSFGLKIGYSLRL